MIFDEKSQKLPQTGSSCVWVTVNDRESGPKPKWCILMIFDEKSQNYPKPEVAVSG
jgi:hypothetical protein